MASGFLASWGRDRSQQALLPGTHGQVHPAVSLEFVWMAGHGAELTAVACSHHVSFCRVGYQGRVETDVGPVPGPSRVVHLTQRGVPQGGWKPFPPLEH